MAKTTHVSEDQGYLQLENKEFSSQESSARATEDDAAKKLEKYASITWTMKGPSLLGQASMRGSCGEDTRSCKKILECSFFVELSLENCVKMNSPKALKL